MWLRGQDLNLRPLGYEPNELPDCSTPRHLGRLSIGVGVGPVKEGPDGGVGVASRMTVSPGRTMASSPRASDSTAAGSVRMASMVASYSSMLSDELDLALFETVSFRFGCRQFLETVGDDGGKETEHHKGSDREQDQRQPFHFLPSANAERPR